MLFRLPSVTNGLRTAHAACTCYAVAPAFLTSSSRMNTSPQVRTANPKSLRLLGVVVTVLLGGVGCQGPSVVPLMPTPILYSENGVSPLDHIPEAEQWKPRKVYYATTRQRTSDLQIIDYNNKEGSRVSVGLALIGFGHDGMSWSDLQEVSKATEREEAVDLSIAGLLEAGSFEPENPASTTNGPGAWLLQDLNQSIRISRDKDLMIYVHGAKVNFYNACAFAAQLDHFMGRDMTSIAFSWPSRQNILQYVFGGDVERAYRSSDSLASLLEILARESGARKIHIVAWSAGSRVVASAVSQLRQRHADMSEAELRKTYRLGTLYFAASEIPRNEFIQKLPDLDIMANRVVVTASSNDSALKYAQRFMGGGPRIGQLAKGLTEEERETILSAKSLEVIDLSLGGEERGFDITGHRYWFDHPWASSDLILAIRSDLDPEKRNLYPTGTRILWGIPANYPDKIRAMKKEEILFEKEAVPRP